MPYDEIERRRTQNNDHDDHYMFGQLMIFNTLDDFNRREKRQLIIDAGQWVNVAKSKRFCSLLMFLYT